MNRQDFVILAELHELQQEQRTGQRPGRGTNSSSVTKRQIDEFALKCERGELKGRKRKREAHTLFLALMRSLADD